MIKRVEGLSEALGDDHDLFMVEEALGSDKLSRQAEDYKALTRRIRSRRRKLQKEAFKIGKVIYADKPGNFRTDLDRCVSELEKVE